MKRTSKPISGQSIRSECRECKNAEFFCDKCTQLYSESQPPQKNEIEAFTENEFFTIAEDNFNGRHLIAAKDILAGTIIWKENPLVAAPINREDRDIFSCIGCYSIYPKTQALQKCSKCDWMVCSKECEKNIEHAENECKRKAPVGSENFSTLCYRFSLLKKTNPSNYIKAMNLNSIPTMDPEDDQEMVKMFKNRELEAERHHFKLEKIVSASEYEIIFYIVKLNAFGLSTYYRGNKGYADQKMMGCGIYQTASLMSHSCIPNCAVEIQTPNNLHNLQVHAAIDIQKGDKLTRYFRERFVKNYLVGVVERQRTLQQDKLLSFRCPVRCMCDLCLDPTEKGTHLSTLMCPGCKKYTLLPHNPGAQAIAQDFEKWEWRCKTSGCNQTMKNSELKELNEKILSLSKEVPITLKDFNKCSQRWLKLKEFKKKVHPNYWAIAVAAKELCRQYCYAYRPPLNSPDFKYHQEIMEYLLKIVNVIRPGLSEEKAELLHRMSCAQYLHFLAKDMPRIKGNYLSTEEMREIVKCLDKILVQEEEALKYFDINPNPDEDLKTRERGEPTPKMLADSCKDDVNYFRIMLQMRQAMHLNL